MSRLQLEVVRWFLAVLALGCVVTGWVLEPRGGTAVALFFLFLIFGTPAAMLTLHLHPPKFFKNGDRY